MDPVLFVDDLLDVDDLLTVDDLRIDYLLYCFRQFLIAQHVSKMMINSTKTSKDASAISIHRASTYSKGPTLTGETSLSMIRVVLSSDIVLLF